MLLIRNLTKYIAGEVLFEKLSLTVQRGDKFGIVGPNGAGKSTLLKIIAGMDEADDGSVELEKERVGYVSQELEFDSGMTVADFLIDVYGAKMDEILADVGLGDLDFGTHISMLSGGQKTRLNLARCLLSRPSMLLLDEPTNHLDYEGIIWLEGFIRNFHGAVLIVSHDRALLNHTVSAVFEIDSHNHTTQLYTGNYDDYLTSRKKKLELQQRDYELQQREKKRLEEWLVLKRQEATVHPDPSKGRQIRMMEKRIQREIYDQEIVKPIHGQAMKRGEFDGAAHAGKLIARTADVSCVFGDTPLFEDVSFELRGTERAIISGLNGSGKSTLLKMIMGQLTPTNGSITIGPNVHVGYFAQEHETLNPDHTVMEAFLATEHLKIIGNPRSVLGAFLFSGDAIYKKVSELSLGERARLMFAGLVHQQNQLLVLDEPTNHLDIQSREVIEAAIKSYEGALLMVSHDRYFVRAVGVEVQIILKDGGVRVVR